MSERAAAPGPGWPPPHELSTCVARRRASPAGVVVCVAATASSAPCFRVVLEDGTGRLTLAFLGRRDVPGIVPGARLQVEGMVASDRGEAVMTNPRYRFLS